jgi:hypothetical protein
MKKRWDRSVLLCSIAVAAYGAFFDVSFAQDANASTSNSTTVSDKLLLTGGVTNIEGTAGGGIVPWAIIGGYGTKDQVGGNAFYTNVGLPSYHLGDTGALIGLFDRVEISYAHERFDTENVGAALGLGHGFTFQQDIVGVKVRLLGDAVLEQDSWIPQIAVGAEYKSNNQEAIVKAVGATRSEGTDYYIAATKLYLDQSVLVDLTVRFTDANQTGLLGFGSNGNTNYHVELEGSVAYLLSRNWAIGAEYRQKPNNLAIAKEDDWYDAFVAWAPTKNVSVTLAYADLGNIVIKDNQRGLYASVQLGF